jgi:hypothetical protein
MTRRQITPDEIDGTTGGMPDEITLDSLKKIQWTNGADHPAYITNVINDGIDNTLRLNANGSGTEPVGKVSFSAWDSTFEYGAIVTMEATAATAIITLNAVSVETPGTFSATGDVTGANLSGTNTGDIALGTNTATALTLTDQTLGIADVFVQTAGDTMTGALTVNIPTATNNAPQTALTLRANVTGGVGSAASFGTYQTFVAESATEGTDRTQAYIGTFWVDATDATRKARQVFTISDTSNREAFRIEATGTAAAIGFLGANAQARPTAYTQTYSTATRTQTAPTAATLTDSTGGTANTTLAAVEATYTQATIRNNFADLAAMVNKNTADTLVLAKLIVQIIDDLQGYGLFG